ncbi:MAG: transposase [Bryobacteraceae bacterium]
MLNSDKKNPRIFTHPCGVGLWPALRYVDHERRLPHYCPPEAILFLTWRLFGSLRDPGKSFAQTDSLLDTVTEGPHWLKDERVADLVAGALDQGENEYRLYERFAWVIMPNHVHVVMRPFRPLPVVMRWIKGSTARSANLLLGRTGKPFWQYETYDHCVRNSDELSRVIRYVERNPVRAGLARAIEEWQWSSASAGQRPTPQKT